MMWSCWPHRAGAFNVLGRFVGGCEAAGMRIGTSKSEIRILYWKKADYSLRLGGEALAQVHKFKFQGLVHE